MDLSHRPNIVRILSSGTFTTCTSSIRTSKSVNPDLRLHPTMFQAICFCPRLGLLNCLSLSLLLGARPRAPPWRFSPSREGTMNGDLLSSVPSPSLMPDHRLNAVHGFPRYPESQQRAATPLYPADLRDNRGISMARTSLVGPVDRVLPLWQCGRLSQA